MSGIFGFVELGERPASQRQLGLMSKALAHRGRQERSWVEGGVALGERERPHTGEAPTGRVAAVAGVVVVADARVDNGDELRRALGLGDTVRSPAELILHAYLRRGVECPAWILGDFAFAVWDGRLRQLFLARDPMGVKPLYYHAGADRLAFATEMGALRVLAGVPTEIDAGEVALQLAWEETDRTRTVYRGIRRLPAAHSLRVGPAGATREPQCYWSLDGIGEAASGGSRDYAAELAEIFARAVRARVCDVPTVATALSGGLDSSSVTCVARDLFRQGAGPEVHAISLLFEGLPEEDRRLIDERSFVDAVVRNGGVVWHPLDGTRLSPLGEVEDTLRSLGQPFAAPNMYLHRAMYREAAQAGAPVFLDGLDGDSAISHGLGRLNSLLFAGQWDTFEREVRSFAGRAGNDVSKVLPHFGLPYLAELAAGGRWGRWSGAAREMARRFDLSRSEVLWRYGVRAALPWLAGEVRPRAAAQADGGVVHPRLLRRRRGAGERGGPRAMREAEAHRSGILQPAYQHTLELADACAAAFGVEPRYPFFDRRLIEFCVSLPEEEKFADGWSRLVLRRAMEGILPPEVQWRTGKSNLSPAFVHGFNHADRERLLATPLRSLAPYASVPALERMRERYARGGMTQWGDPNAYQLFRAAVVARWIEQAGRRDAAAEHTEAGPSVSTGPAAPARTRRRRSPVA